MDNLQLYNKVREVPKEAQKTIFGGRLKGKTDINPMWRIKTLTEQFGVCGIGWYYEIKEKRLETGAGGEIAAFVDIELFINSNGTWSFGIPGTGGSMFVANEKNGLYTSDECYKMALTDALSVSCKALGIGADVYWEADKTKYTKPNITSDLTPTDDNPIFETPQKITNKVDEKQAQSIYNIALIKGYNEGIVNATSKKHYGTDNIFELTSEQGEALYKRFEELKK